MPDTYDLMGCSDNETSYRKWPMIWPSMAFRKPPLSSTLFTDRHEPLNKIQYCVNLDIKLKIFIRFCSCYTFQSSSQRECVITYKEFTDVLSCYLYFYWNAIYCKRVIIWDVESFLWFPKRLCLSKRDELYLLSCCNYKSRNAEHIACMINFRIVKVRRENTPANTGIPMRTNWALMALITWSFL